MSHAPRYWIGLLALVAVWGSSYALIEIALPVLDPLEVTAARIALGLVVMLTISLAAGIPWPRGSATYLGLAGVSLFGNVLPFLLISWGQTHIDSAAAGVLMASMPLSVLVFTHLLLPDDPLTRWHWLGFALGMAGIVVLLAPELRWPVAGPLSGHFAVLGGALCYGFSAVIARTLPPSNVWTNTTVLLACGVVFLSPVVVLAGADFRGLGANQATMALAFLGVFSTSLASVLFLAIVRGTSAAFISNINYLIPLWAVAVGAALMGESLPPTMLAALLLVLTGIAVAQRRAQAP